MDDIRYVNYYPSASEGCTSVLDFVRTRMRNVHAPTGLLKGVAMARIPSTRYRFPRGHSDIPKPGVPPPLKFMSRAVAFALVGSAAPVHAGPAGEQVVAGQATVSRAGANTLITQTTDRAAINWQSFNIGAAESVRFAQPSVSSIALNRVLSSEPDGNSGVALGQRAGLHPQSERRAVRARRAGGRGRHRRLDLEPGQRGLHGRAPSL